MTFCSRASFHRLLCLSAEKRQTDRDRLELSVSITQTINGVHEKSDNFSKLTHAINEVYLDP